jgi:hypothetical protein
MTNPTMIVLDHEPALWFLLQEGEDFIFDAACSHSFISYTLTMKLNADEIARYKQEGREYLSKLAYEVHYSAPLVKLDSPYRSRDISKEYGKAMTQVIVKWRKEQGLD